MLTNLERRQAFLSSVNSIFTNKLSATINFMLNRLASAFSPHLLFMQVEPAVSGFSVWVHGIFYWIEGLMIVVAVGWLLGKKQNLPLGVVLLFGILVFSFPTLINTGSEWHLLRTMLSYTVMVMLAGIGLGLILKNKWVRLVVIPLYLLAIFNFTYIYFYRYPVISLDWANYQERVVSRYVALTAQEHPDVKVSIHVSQPDYYYWNYLLFNNRITNETKDLLAQNDIAHKGRNDQKFEIDNVIFTNSCTVDDDVDVMLAESSFRPCESRLYQPENPKSIVAVLDSGEKLYIINDKLCSNVKLKSYVYPTNFTDIDLENLNTEEFCYKWIADQ